jgi:hypothetical protein
MYRPNDFLARPGQKGGEPTLGTHRYPGFHTARDREVTVPYAQQRVIAPHSEPEDTLQDFPVIVELDMDGLTRLPDYDAIMFASEPVSIVAIEALKSDDPAAFLQSYAEMGESELRSFSGGDDVVEALAEGFWSNVSSAADGLSDMLVLALLGEDKDLSAAQAMDVLKRLARKKPDPEIVMELIGQYRYEQDVPTSRIVDVDYLKPYWPEVIDASEEPGEEEAMRVEALGYEVVDVDSADNRQIGVVTSPAFAARARRRRKPKRLEYHGTSLLNLLSAAPELGRKLVRPPPPYAGAFRGA